MKMHFLPKQKNTRIILAAILVLIIVAAVVFKFLPFGMNQGNPTETAATAIENLKNTPALSFRTVSTLTVAEQSREYGNINGELLQNGDFHIKGSILGSQIDLYQIDSTTYRLDNVTANWQKTTENAAFYQTALFNETNPLEQFNITDMGDVQKAQGDEKDLFGYTFTPTLTENSTSRYFTNITYTIYCSRQGELKKAVVTGDLTNNSVSGKLHILTVFNRLDDKYQITPPIIE